MIFIPQLSATDNDSDKRIEFRLLSVSNNGIRKFAVEPTSGKVNVIGAVRAGDHFSLTVAAVDSGGKTTQAVMEVILGLIVFCSAALTSAGMGSTNYLSLSLVALFTCF